MKHLKIFMTFVVAAMSVVMVSCEKGNEPGQGNKLNGHEYVDLGLSVKWASCNVGATTPEGYGDYFEWGEIIPMEECAWDDCITLGDISGNPQYDAARAIWGGRWRIPTRTECEELLNNCTWTWSVQNGVNGYKITGPNGNSIFLPAAGSTEDGRYYNQGEGGGIGVLLHTNTIENIQTIKLVLIASGIP
ncbi:MAG: hypothetical protein IKJ79_00615 [Bacteroidaceae bacterium]|nr:hypothetical protein [Bacteroidaceae bacterium]